MCCFFKVSGGCFNPALIFGASFLCRYLPPYHWIYYFAPVLGAIVGASAYIIYEYTVNDDATGHDFKDDDEGELDVRIERKTEQL